MSESVYTVEESRMDGSILCSGMLVSSSTESRLSKWKIVPNDPSVRPFTLTQAGKTFKLGSLYKSQASIVQALRASGYFRGLGRETTTEVFLLLKEDGTLSIEEDLESPVIALPKADDWAELQTLFVEAIVEAYNTFTQKDLHRTAIRMRRRLWRSLQDRTRTEMMQVGGQEWMDRKSLDKVVDAIAQQPRTACFDWQDVIKDVVAALRRQDMEKAQPLAFRGKPSDDPSSS